MESTGTPLVPAWRRFAFAQPALAAAALGAFAFAVAFPAWRFAAAPAALAAALGLAWRARRDAAREREALRAEAAAARRENGETLTALMKAHVDLEVRAAELVEAHRHLDLALQGSNDGVWEYDLRSQAVYLSPGFRERLGVEPGDHAEGPLAWFEAHLHPDDLAPWRAAVQEHLEQRASYNLDIRLRTPAGDYRWFRARGLAEWDFTGRPVRTSGSLTDITERRFAELRLRESEESFRLLSAASPVGILRTDARGRCEYCNDRWQEITGRTDFEVIGEPWLLAVVREDRDATTARWEAFVGGGGAFDAPFRVQPPRGAERWIRSRANAVAGPGGSVAGYVITFEDVTGEQLAAMALADARDKAMQATQAKSEFLANMSHEIRTPLNGIVGMAQLLAGTRLTEDQHDYVRTINTSADTLLAIINDILDFSKIEAGKMQVERVDFDLRTLFEDVAELLAPRARENGLELVIGVAPSVPARVTGDPTRIRQVLLNLTSNAIKFTERGEIVLSAETMRVGGSEAESFVRIGVRDTGIGIAAERLGAVFDSFTQADGSTTRRYGGTGLGLTICRQLAQLMGGTIHVASEAGAGSEFWIEVPLPAARRAEPARRPCDLGGARVVVAGGHAVNRRRLAEMVRDLGGAPEPADDAWATLEIARTPAAGMHEVVLVDHGPHGLDGLAVAKALRTVGGAMRRVVFVLSSSAPPPEAAPLIGEGRAIEAWLMRPVREAALARALGRALGLAGPPVAPEAASGMPHEASSLRLLLVDDNEINRKVALRMLQKLGAAADVAVNGAEAVRRIVGDGYDLVFMDCQMPVMDGFEATRAVREHEAAHGGHVRIVAMTANAMDGDRERCLACGMDDYMAKPVRMEELAEHVRLAREAASSEGRRAA